MFKQGVGRVLRNRASGVAQTRGFLSGKTVHSEKSDILPSDPEMKSTAWTSKPAEDMDITRRVAGMAKNVQERGRPPVEVDKSFLKNFVAGQIYDSFDFSMTKVNMESKWARAKKNPARTYTYGKDDVFDKAGIDPRDLYTMPEILSKFISTTGQILPREVTGCTAANQKEVGYSYQESTCCWTTFEY